MNTTSQNNLSRLIPVMLCFFAMGFVDLVGIASNYVKADLGLSDSQANIFPSDIFSTYRNSDEPYRSQENSTVESCSDIRFIASAYIR